jgi:hypothetical protein
VLRPVCEFAWKLPLLLLHTHKHALTIILVPFGFVRQCKANTDPMKDVFIANSAEMFNGPLIFLEDLSSARRGNTACSRTRQLAALHPPHWQHHCQL